MPNHIRKSSRYTHIEGNLIEIRERMNVRESDTNVSDIVKVLLQRPTNFFFNITKKYCDGNSNLTFQVHSKCPESKYRNHYVLIYRKNPFALVFLYTWTYKLIFYMVIFLSTSSIPFSVHSTFGFSSFLSVSCIFCSRLKTWSS